MKKQLEKEKKLTKEFSYKVVELMTNFEEEKGEDFNLKCVFYSYLSLMLSTFDIMDKENKIYAIQILKLQIKRLIDEHE